MSWPIESKAFLTQPISDHERKVYPPEIQDRYPKIAMFESKYIFQTIIFGIYVGFWGCKLYISYHIVISKPLPLKSWPTNTELIPWFLLLWKVSSQPFFFNGPTNNCFKQQKIKTAKRWSKPWWDRFGTSVPIALANAQCATNHPGQRVGTRWKVYLSGMVGLAYGRSIQW